MITDTYWVHDRTGMTLCADGNTYAEPTERYVDMHECTNCGQRLGVAYDKAEKS